MIKSLRIVSASLAAIFACLNYGGYDPVVWAGTLGMIVATISLLLVPEEI